MQFRASHFVLPAFAAVALVLVGAAPRAEDAAVPAGGSLRRIESKHLTLYTDLPPGGEVDALAGYFDQAFDQWCDYFNIDASQHADWHMRGYLMKSAERFQASGMLPADLPKFKSGYARGDELWLFDQASVYYRRHLLLHEGTHAFMYALVGAQGPPWYFEGMAELLATHRLEKGKLTLNVFPRTRDEVSKLGRVEIVQTAVAAGHGLSLEQIFAYGPRAHFQNEPYGWCWAAAAFFDGQPRYRERFRQLARRPGQHDMTADLAAAFADDWERINDDWRLYVANLDYGYDFARMDVEFAPGEALAAGGHTLRIAADRGWQSSGVRLEAGDTCRIRASGRYQVASQPKPWLCEPGGVTIRYVHGQPLGILLGAIHGEHVDDEADGLLKPLVVGFETTFHTERAGTLYLRVNDSAGGLSDNSGSLSVEIARVPAEAGSAVEP
jgi:hypothetical protein